MALGAMDLAVLLVGASLFVGSRQGPASGTPGNILAGVACLGLFCSAGVVGSLDGKHGLALAFPVTAPALLCWGGGIASGIGFCAGIFARVFPSLFSASTLIGQNIELGHILNLVHCQLFTHLAIAHFWWNALITTAGRKSGMFYCTRLNLWMYLRRVSPSFWGMICKSLAWP